MANLETPVNQSKPTTNIPEQRANSDKALTLEELYTKFIENITETDHTLLAVDKSVDDVPIHELTRLLKEESQTHGVEIKQIVSTERGVGNYAITHTASVSASEIIKCTIKALNLEVPEIHITNANIAMAVLLSSSTKRSESVKLLRQKLQNLDPNLLRFSNIISELRRKADDGDSSLSRYVDQFYEAEILAIIYTLQHA